jgi:hypothetical protein
MPHGDSEQPATVRQPAPIALIEDLLTLSRIESGTFTLERCALDLCTIGTLPVQRRAGTGDPGHRPGLSIVQSIVQSIVHSHGGEISVRSRHLLGTQVRVVLPLLHARPTSMPVDRRPLMTSGGRGTPSR